MDHNIISKILADYPDAWKDTRKFKALLLDFLPEDKRLRNLIVISVEEGIPDDIFQSKSMDELKENAYTKRLINAVGCNNEDATLVVNLWTSALDNSLSESKKEKNNADEHVIDNEKLRRIKYNFLSQISEARKTNTLDMVKTVNNVEKMILEELMNK